MNDLNHLQLVNSRIQKLNLSRKEVVNRMGYKNKSKGYQLLDNVRKGKFPKGGQIDLLAEALNLDKETLKKAMENSEEEIRERKNEIKRKNFKPFLCAMGERSIPSPIYMGIMVDSHRYVYYEDDFLDLEKGDQLKRLKSDVKKHYRETDGGIQPFGKTTHYIFKKSFDTAKEDILVFDIDGALIKENLADYRRSAGGGKLSVSGKELRLSLEEK